MDSPVDDRIAEIEWFILERGGGIDLAIGAGNFIRRAIADGRINPDQLATLEIRYTE